MRGTRRYSATHGRFLELIDAFTGGESTASVIAALGEPRARSAAGAEEILVFAPDHGWSGRSAPATLGFTNDRLFWIAWNFTPLRLGDAAD